MLYLQQFPASGTLVPDFLGVLAQLLESHNLEKVGGRRRGSLNETLDDGFRYVLLYDRINCLASFVVVVVVVINPNFRHGRIRCWRICD